MEEILGKIKISDLTKSELEQIIASCKKQIEWQNVLNAKNRLLKLTKNKNVVKLLKRIDGMVFSFERVKYMVNDTYEIIFDNIICSMRYVGPEDDGKTKFVIRSKSPDDTILFYADMEYEDFDMIVDNFDSYVQNTEKLTEITMQMGFGKKINIFVCSLWDLLIMTREHKIYKLFE